MGSSHGQQAIQGVCVSETAVHDYGRRLNQREFRPMAEVPFRLAHQLSKKEKGPLLAGKEMFGRRFVTLIYSEYIHLI